MSDLALIRRAKRAGMTASDVWTTMNASMTKAAKAQGWRPSELAATKADAQMDLVKVYGKRATKGLFDSKE